LLTNKKALFKTGLANMIMLFKVLENYG